MIKVYHNPRCSKSRCAIEHLNQKGETFEVIEYLSKPLTAIDLREILHMLDIHPLELIRKGEEDFKTHFRGKELSDDEWIDAMVRFPKLIERPIVVRDQRAVVARPTERINTLFE
jgi:arsenate reductase